MKPLKWLLRNQLKLSRTKQKIYGFTLIELLVAMIIAFLIITPLLGFMINILDNDRKEQAKATTEQEIKTTLDYITRDLQQSVYIYDADGIKNIRSQLPKYDNKSQYFPVLVFWKRRYISGGLVVSTTTTGSGATATTTNNTDDTFVYSLVAYYLIKDGDATWSNAARIGRFELSNGYGQISTDITNTTDKNFKLFDLSNEGTLRTKMNKWANAGVGYDTGPLAVVDYIDQTPINSATNPAPSCPVISDPDSPATSPTNLHNQVPDFSSNAGGDATPGSTDGVNTQGFYVCVDSTKTTAQIYLRGNALARLQTSNLSFDQTNSSRQTYFPTASTQVQGIGFLFTK